MYKNSEKNGADINKFTKSMHESNLDESIRTYKVEFNTADVMKEVGKDGSIESPKNRKYDDKEEGYFKNKDHKHLFERYYPCFGNSENKYYLNVVISDEQGNIKWLDLSSFIRTPRVQEISKSKNETLQE